MRMITITTATSLVLRRLNHLHWCPLSSKWCDPVLSQPIKYFKNSSITNCYPSKFGTLFNVSKKQVNRLLVRDNVPEGYMLIYKAPMELTLKTAYPLILFCTVAAPLYAFCDYYKKGKIEYVKEPKLRNVLTHFSNPEREIWYFSGLLILSAAGAFAVIFKFPFRVYKHNVQQEYIAMFLSAVPLTLRQFCFTTATYTKFRNPLYFFMKDCHYIVDKKKAFLLAHYFRTPADMCEMLGVA